MTVYFQPVQDVQISTRASRAQFQYTLVGASSEEVSRWSARLVEKLRNAAVLREVVSEAQDGGLRAFVKVDRDTAGRLGVSMQAVNDALNDALYQSHRERPYEAIRELLRGSHGAMLLLLETFSQAELTDSDEFPWLGGQALGDVAHECLGAHYDWALRTFDNAGIA